MLTSVMIMWVPLLLKDLLEKINMDTRRLLIWVYGRQQMEVKQIWIDQLSSLEVQMKKMKKEEAS